MKQAHCEVCGTTIARDTAKATGGRCIPCSRAAPEGYRKSSPVPVDADAWAEASKGSVDHAFAPAYYEDEFYRCAACGARSVFTAREQKESFEVRKNIIWQRRTLCHGCWHKRRSLEAELEGVSSQWAENRNELQKDSAFLQRWLEILKELPRYGRPRNESIIRMLERLLDAGTRS